jgi:hypothetical protein
VNVPHDLQPTLLFFYLFLTTSRPQSEKLGANESRLAKMMARHAPTGFLAVFFWRFQRFYSF